MLPAPISSLSPVLVQNLAARWKAAEPVWLISAHLYLDLPNTVYLLHNGSGGIETIYHDNNFLKNTHNAHPTAYSWGKNFEKFCECIGKKIYEFSLLFYPSKYFYSEIAFLVLITLYCHIPYNYSQLFINILFLVLRANCIPQSPGNNYRENEWVTKFNGVLGQIKEKANGKYILIRLNAFQEMAENQIRN